jgi:hypothetical protein
LKASAAAAITGRRAVDPDTVTTFSSAADKGIIIMRINIIVDVTLILIIPPYSYRDLNVKNLAVKTEKIYEGLAEREIAKDYPSRPWLRDNP